MVNAYNAHKVVSKLLTHRSKMYIILVSDPYSIGCFRYWFSSKFLCAYMNVPHSLFAALPYPETGHACGSVKPLDPATFSWKQLADFHSYVYAVGLRPAWKSVSGSELRCLRWSTLRSSPDVVGLRPGNKSGWSSQLGPPNATHISSHLFLNFSFS